MNHDQRNKPPGADNDPMVSAEYRASATERAPTALDSAVLANARAAIRNNSLRRFTGFWFRPLAFVATLGLSLALLLELTGPMNTQSDADTDPEAGYLEVEPADPIPLRDKASDVPPDSGPPAESNRSAGPPAPAQADISANDRGRQQLLESAPSTASGIGAAGMPSSANAVIADDDTSADFAEMIEASSRQMQQPEAVTEIAIQGRKETRTTDIEGGREIAAFGVSAAMLKQVARPCTPTEVKTPETWWKCISDLEEAGRHEEAKTETDLFHHAHPGFEAAAVPTSQ